MVVEPKPASLEVTYSVVKKFMGTSPESQCDPYADDQEMASRLAQSKMLAQKIGLPQDHYLRLHHPLPPSLIASMSIFTMPGYLQQELLSAHTAGKFKS